MVRLPQIPKRKPKAEPLPTPPQPDNGKNVSALESQKTQGHIEIAKSQNPARDIVSIMASEQRRVFLISFVYFISMPLGVTALLGSGLYLLGPTFLVAVLITWILFMTAFVLVVAFLSYRPIREISDWLDKVLLQEDA